MFWNFCKFIQLLEDFCKKCDRKQRINVSSMEQKKSSKNRDIRITPCSENRGSIVLPFGLGYLGYEHFSITHYLQGNVRKMTSSCILHPS